jgi:hypothetical protein
MMLTSRSAPLPDAAGSPGLAQGSYGEAGNLELVMPARDGGYWCFWFNADPVDHHSGAVRGCWSAGLHVPGPLCTVVRIAQFAVGPDFLEVLMVSGEALVRQHWTPGEGFVSDGPIPLERSVTWCSASVERDGMAHAVVVTADRELMHLHAPLTDYPRLSWSAEVIETGIAVAELAASAEGLTCSIVADGGSLRVLRYDDQLERWDEPLEYQGRWARAVVTVPPATGIVLGVDSAGQAKVIDPSGHEHALCPDVHADDLTACSTTLDGGRIDLVLRTGTELRHLSVGPNVSEASAEPIVSQVWI